MLFQTLDDKKECYAIYINKNFDKNINNNLTKSWSYNSAFKRRNIEYANLYVNGKNLEEICPQELKNELASSNKKLKAILNSFIEAKISLKENCFYDLAPQKSLKDYCEIKNKICDYVFANVEKPKEYKFLHRFTELINDIKFRELNIDLDSLKHKLADEKTLSFYRKMLESPTTIEYNLFGSITGRLTTTKNSFPIQTFPSVYREILKPKNDWFVSFDMNAAELRTSIALIEKQQPDIDLYEQLKSTVFNDDLNRTEIKKSVTAWLYNSTNEIGKKYNNELENYFEKNKLKKLYWDGKYVNTPFNRKIESDDYHAISHLNQSTFIDLFHRQIIKVDDYLNECESFISFLLHDEFVIDMKNEEKEKILDIINILQDTQFGKFIVNVKVGKDFGNMKKLKLKG